MIGFFRFFAERHLGATLVSGLVIVIGLVTIFNIKRDTFPQVDLGRVVITTRYPGASPEDVELKVTNKIESQLAGVAGVDRYTSYSVENLSIVDVILEETVDDIEEVKRDIKDSIDRVSSFPPEVTQEPFYLDIESSNMPVVDVAVSGHTDYRVLRKVALQFEKKLKNVDGVSFLVRYGWREPEVQVQVLPQRLKQYHVSLREIVTAIKRRNVRGTGGTFESFTSEKNIVTLSQFTHPQEVADVIVRSNFDGPQIKVGDLATVVEDFESEGIISRVNGIPSVSFEVHKNKNADIVRVVEGIEELIAEQSSALPDGVKLQIANDASRLVKNRFSIVLANGVLGFLLVLGSLSLFLNPRLALWVAFGMPVTFFGVIALLPVFDLFIDSITLTAMLLVLGIIVDDAIVVAENIQSAYERGDKPVDAAVRGVFGVSKPVVTTVLTTFVAFAPMLFMPGIMGKFNRVVPIAVSLALFVSLWEALLALPAHLAHSIAKQKPGAKKPLVGEYLRQMRKQFQRFIYLLLKARYVCVALFLSILFFAIVFAQRFLDFVLFPTSGADSVIVHIELPTGTTIEQNKKKTAEIEEIIESINPEWIDSYASRIGLRLNEDRSIGTEGEQYSTLFLRLTPYDERDDSADKVVEAIREQTSKLKGIKDIIFNIETGGPPLGKPVMLYAISADDNEREKLASRIVAELQQIEGTSDLARSDIVGKEQIEIQLDYSKLARAGLTVADVAQTVRVAYDGEDVTTVRYGEEDVDFRVLFTRASRKDASYLESLLIPNSNRRLIPLKQVAELKTSPGPSNYFHFDGERTIAVSGSLDSAKATPLEVSSKVLASIDLAKEFPGARLLVGGEAQESIKSIKSLAIAMLVALVGIYCLLVLLFNSLVQPLAVLATVPFGIVGVIFGFALHGEPLGFLAIIGVIGLSGIVVNDSIILINHINKLRVAARKHPLLSVIAYATGDRLRAILITTITTVAGLLPLGFGIGGADPYMSPMALAIGYGLMFGTTLTLFLVPCLYAIGADVVNLLSKFKTPRV